MVTVHWSRRYETGIAVIDGQHQHLFRVINELIDAFRRGDPDREVTRVIDYLITYTMDHLRTEEAWMKEQGYPGLAAHMEEHEVFMSQVDGLKRRFEAGELMTMDVTVLLADWLEYHVEGSDIAYAEYARQVNGFKHVS